MRRTNTSQGGFFLIEALVAIAIFSLGILGMLSIAGISTNAQTDARFRADAASLANELASDIVLHADRTTLAALQASLVTYQNQPGGGDCAFTGDLSANADVVAWRTKVTTTGPGLPGLPGATATSEQVLVDTSAAGYNRVQITVCWKGPNDAAMRRHTLVTYVNGIV